MANQVANLVVSARDRAVLALLDRTPATTALILRASETFEGGSFRDERRVRERMQNLTNGGLTRSWPLALPGGGTMNYYKLSVAGFRLLHGDQVPQPHNRFFAPVPLARLQHTYTLSEVIVHTMVAAHRHHIRVSRFCRENAVVLEAGPFKQQPDCIFQLTTSGRTFTVLFEVDNSTESLDSSSHQSIRQKILGYDAYQNQVLNTWKNAGRQGPRPSFRVAFLTRSIDRAHHVLLLADQLTRNKDRRLCYGATQDAYLGELDALRNPLFLDHRGDWQSLVNIHPSTPFPKPPVRLRPPVALQLAI